LKKKFQIPYILKTCTKFVSILHKENFITIIKKINSSKLVEKEKLHIQKTEKTLLDTFGPLFSVIACWLDRKKTCILQRIFQWTFPLILLAICKAVLKKTVKMWKVYIWRWGTQSDGNTLLFGSVKLKYIFGTILYMTHIILIYKNISLYFNIFLKFYKIKQLIIIYIYKILTVSNIHHVQ
jgi:ABC-type phosphate transport system permease subunit